MIKLYYTPHTRAGRARWMLEEVGAPYELERIDLKSGGHKKPEYLKVHPHGVVPAMTDGNLTMFESAAIVAYLADKYPDKKLAPAPGTPERGTYYQWLFYSVATMETPVLNYFLHSSGSFLPEAQRQPAIAEEGRKKFFESCAVVTKALKGREWIATDRFSAADVMVGGMLGWAGRMGLLAEFPDLQKYVERCTSRPAFQKAMAD